MDNTFVEAVAKLAETKIVSLDGLDYTTKQVYQPPRQALATVLEVRTLSGLLQNFRIDNYPKEVFVHVESPTVVSVVEKLQGDRHGFSRQVFARATYEPSFEEGALSGSCTAEHMIVALQARFYLTDDRERLLALLSNVKEEATRTSSDDGVSQTLATRAGMVLGKEAKIANPFMLAPFRTFRELPVPPASPFIVRAHGGSQQTLPTFSLNLADGGAWELDAMKAIQDWLTANGPKDLDVVVVA